MIKKITVHSLFTALAIISASSSNTLGAEQNNILKDTYLTVGFGKSMPQSKISSYTFAYPDNFYANKKLKDSNIYKIAVGKRFNQFRAEFEFLYSGKHKVAYSSRVVLPTVTEPLDYKYSISNKAVFLNGYYDFKGLHNSIKPYVGVGIGLSQNTISNEIVPQIGKWNKKSSNSFAYNASLGVLFEVNKSFYIDLSYKFVNLGKLKGSTEFIYFNNDREATSANVKGNIKSNILLLGAGIRF